MTKPKYPTLFNSKFAITTFQSYSEQFSRVADRSIITGIDREALRTRTAHLSEAELLLLSQQLTRGSGTYYDTNGKLCMVNVIDRS